MTNFPFHGRMFTKKQIEFVVEVMIASTINVVTSNIPLRWMDGLKDREWENEKKGQWRRDTGELINGTVQTLGWNLSILYAQITGDGMGVADALEIAKLGETIELWANEVREGTKGITPNPEDNQNGHVDEPEKGSLAHAWVETVFKDRRLPEERK